MHSRSLPSVVAASASAYTPPRLEDGRPDLQGNWVAYNRTPLARPDSLTELYITIEQAREIEARGNARERDLSIPNETPEFFDERRVALIGGKLRSSSHRARGRKNSRHAVDAREGRGVARAESRRHGRTRAAAAVGALPQLLGVACADAGGRLHEPASDRADARRGRVLSESLHDARIFRLERHASAGGRRRHCAGASIARWDGDTLEVETRNFKADQNRASDFLISTQTVIVERFTLTSYDELNYKFTITDPVHYTRPWTGETQYLRSNEAIFEDACHEGNYSLKHILEGGACATARCANELVADRLSVLAVIRASAINASVRRDHDGLEAAHRSTVDRLDLVPHALQLLADQLEQL